MKTNMKFVLLSLLLTYVAFACPPNCLDCDSSAAYCYACDEKFELTVTGTCVNSNIIDKCTVYGPTNQCYACQPSFQLSNGKCVK